mmetsp:Transcript_24171/g.40964  ORF Transcript_24171/g.40964 Transcript_24171/m.40964 type:complete len:235 (-) Transcript_24171:132-836(-)
MKTWRNPSLQMTKHTLQRIKSDHGITIRQTKQCNNQEESITEMVMKSNTKSARCSRVYIQTPRSLEHQAATLFTTLAQALFRVRGSSIAMLITLIKVRKGKSMPFNIHHSDPSMLLQPVVVAEEGTQRGYTQVTECMKRCSHSPKCHSHVSTNSSLGTTIISRHSTTIRSPSTSSSSSSSCLILSSIRSCSRRMGRRRHGLSRPKTRPRVFFNRHRVILQRVLLLLLNQRQRWR